MDDRRFDALARSLAAGVSRRQSLRGLLGFTGALGGIALTHEADAARRGFSGPPLLCSPRCDGTTCADDGCGRPCRCEDVSPHCLCLADHLDGASAVCFTTAGLDPTERCPDDAYCIARHWGKCDVPSGACYDTCQ